MKPRRYRLLCPIARALDRVGDRWTLLIIRDLHAGPARFSELQSLPGIASNLLTNRLRELEDGGLIRRRDAAYGTTVYELTAHGAKTANLLFELAAFGARFPPDDPVKRPGNLRAIAVTLSVALQRVVDPSMSLHAELIVDSDSFAITIDSCVVDVKAGHADEPAAVLQTEYEPMVAVADGRMPIEEFTARHARLSGPNSAQANLLGALMEKAIAAMNP